jgi:polyferredoxin
VLWTIIIVAAFALTNRVPVKVDVIRDRITMVAPDDPLVENVYRLQVMNTSEKPRQFRISASGIDGVELESQTQPITIDGASQRVIPVRLRADKRQTRPGANDVLFTVETVGSDEQIVIEEDATFIRPKNY